tara:strand:+ start:1411 stop:1566 length:156 start_codon:yes stop_codon:yes gene_type:complete
MSYSVYLDRNQVFDHLSEEEAKERQKEFRQMIQAGIPSAYTAEQVTIKIDP